MSKRAEEYANAQYPQMWVNRTPTSFEKVDYNEHARRAARIAYGQAEKDLALTLEDIVRLDLLIMNMVGEGYNDGYKTRPFYEEVLRRFNDQYRKK